MNSTSTVTPASKRLQSALPSEAQELLMIERRERERVEKEQESLLAREAALEQELASELAEEERSVAQEGMQLLQEFSKHDLTDYLKKESSETEKQEELVKNNGLVNVNKGAKTLLDATLSNDFLPSL